MYFLAILYFFFSLGFILCTCLHNKNLSKIFYPLLPYHDKASNAFKMLHAAKRKKIRLMSTNALFCKGNSFYQQAVIYSCLNAV